MEKIMTGISSFENLAAAFGLKVGRQVPAQKRLGLAQKGMSR